jgi:uracil-DNA glycosylase
MIGPVVHGPPVVSRILLIGQAPGPREGSFGRPFAWTAGKTLFRWFDETLGIPEEEFRSGVYIAAVARCFPGKANGGGDRKPDAEEIARCKKFLEREVEILEPSLILPVGTMAIEAALGLLPSRRLVDIIGTQQRVTFHGHETDVIPLPHPSGASPWHKMEPGKTLLTHAIELVGAHPEMRRAFPRGRSGARAAGSSPDLEQP